MDRFSLPFIALMFGALQAGAATVVCADHEHAGRLIRELNISYDSFAGPKLCDETNKLFRDLTLLEEGYFAGTSRNPFIQDFVAADDYYPWLVSQTRGMERGHDLPWASAFNSWGYFAIQDGWAKLSTIGRIGTLVHEARHTEGFSHTSCEQGPYRDSGIAGCDETAAAGGAHAVEMEYYSRVALQGANFHPVYQSMARLLLQARSNYVFNESPAKSEDLLLARTAEGWLRIQGDSKAFVDHSHSANPDVKEVDAGLRRYQVALVGEKIVSSAIGQPSAVEETWPEIAQLATTDNLGRSGLFALFNDQTYCPVQVPKLKCERAPMPWPVGAKQFVKFAGQVLRLDFDGHVYDSNGELWPALRGTEVFDLSVSRSLEVFD
jgi:hypothetical protein